MFLRKWRMESDSRSSLPPGALGLLLHLGAALEQFEINFGVEEDEALLAKLAEDTRCSRDWQPAAKAIYLEAARPPLFLVPVAMQGAAMPA